MIDTARDFWESRHRGEEAVVVMNAGDALRVVSYEADGNEHASDEVKRDGDAVRTTLHSVRDDRNWTITVHKGALPSNHAEVVVGEDKQAGGFVVIRRHGNNVLVEGSGEKATLPREPGTASTWTWRDAMKATIHTGPCE